MIAAATTPAWVTVLIAALVPVAALAGVWANVTIDKRRAEREVTQAEAARAAARAEAREAFQRATLLEVQDALQRFMRSVAQIQHHDLVEHRHQRDGGRWGSTQHDAELSEAARQSIVDVRHLSGRLLDDDLRMALAATVEAGALVTSARSEDASEDRFRVAAEATEVTSEMIAAAFRSIA